MCQFVIRDEEVYELMGELEQLIPREGWVYDSAYQYEHYAADCCLCPLDLPSTLDKAGYTSKKVDGVAYVIETKEEG